MPPFGYFSLIRFERLPRVRTGEAGQERMVGGWNRQGEVRILANMFFPEVYDLEGD